MSMGYDDMYDDAAYREQMDAGEAWRAANPEHCRDCGGWGVTSFSQSHPYGSTTATETFLDPCDCINSGKCPRCGAIGIAVPDDGQIERPCRNCGWNFDDGDPAI